MRLGLGVLFLIAICCSFVFSADSVSISLERIIDLTTQFVDEEVYYEVTNTGKTSLEHFEIALKSDNLSLWSISKVTDKKGDNQQIIEKLSEIPHASARLETHNDISYNIIRVTFDTPLKSSGKALIKVAAIYTHELEPRPREITQADLQKMYYKGNHFIATVYPCAQQITQVRSMQVVSYSKNETPNYINDENQVVTFGPYKSVPAWSFSESFVHVFNTAPFITVDHLVKDIEVSHWGNIAVEESYLLHHGGTPLKGKFSRLDYMMGQHGNSIREFVFHLPEGANGVYYRDIIGNISTSHVFPHQDFVQLEIQPRFVLFGGWQDEFKMGFNLPTNYLEVDGTRYTLRLPFINNFDDAVFDDVLINVILPEGSYDVEIQSTVNTYELQQSLKQTYLDTTGRVVVSFRASNLISEHRYQQLVVSYSFESSGMVREPLFLIAGYCCLFLLAIVYFRSNITIHDDTDASIENVRSKQLVNEYLELLRVRDTKYEPLSGKNLAKKIGQFNTDINASYARSQSLISKLSAIDPDMASELRRAEQKSKKKTIAHRELQTMAQAPQNEKTKLRVAQLNEEFAQASESLRKQLQRLSDSLSE